MINWTKLENEYYEVPEPKEFDLCECCEKLPCQIFNGRHICEDCQEEKWLQQFEEL